MQNNQVIVLEMTLEETNLVLASLARQPYEAVFKTVEKIREQAERQLKEASSEEASAS